MGTDEPQNIENLKREITTQIADLSKLLGTIPGNDATVSEARASFLKLSLLIDQALDLKLK